MQKKSNVLGVSDSLIHHCVRAKYYVGANGIPVLAQIQKFNQPRFRESGWETQESGTSGSVFDVVENLVEKVEDDNEGGKYANIERASRRAKISAFDAIMCNQDLDCFVTFTYSPEDVDDKADYDGCYKALAIWLSNRVQRKGLKYVLVPERTKKGDIHFHAIMNSDALRLVRAYSAKSGRALTHNGKPLYNVEDWKHGFTSAELIPDVDGDRQAVAKYIFKYMGKQMGQKIGGRYVLHGGDLKQPLFVYGEDEREFFDEETSAKYERSVSIDGDDLIYSEWSFI